MSKFVPYKTMDILKNINVYMENRANIFSREIDASFRLICGSRLENIRITISRNNYIGNPHRLSNQRAIIRKSSICGSGRIFSTSSAKSLKRLMSKHLLAFAINTWLRDVHCAAMIRNRASGNYRLIFMQGVIWNWLRV